MHLPTQISVPTLVRVKENALDRLGIYLRRDERRRVAVLFSQGLKRSIVDRAAAVRLAPSIKENYYTVLSSRDVLPEVERLLIDDVHLKSCFID